jgi:hypothetical protein
MNMLIYMNRFHLTVKRMLEQKVSRWDQLYRRSNTASLIIANFLNIATIPFIVKSLKHSLSGLPERRKDVFQSASILRGYALALSWSPLDAAVSTAIDMTNTHFIYIMPIMLGLALSAVLVDVGVSYQRYGKLTFRADPSAFKQEDSRFPLQEISQLALFLVLFIVIVSMVQMTLGQSFLISIVMILPIYCWDWPFLKRKVRVDRRKLEKAYVISCQLLFYVFVCGLVCEHGYRHKRNRGGALFVRSGGAYAVPFLFSYGRLFCRRVYVWVSPIGVVRGIRSHCPNHDRTFSSNSVYGCLRRLLHSHGHV